MTHWQWEASRVPSLGELATYIRAKIQTNNTEINVQLQAPFICYKNIPRVKSPVVETANCLCRNEHDWNHPLHFTVRPFTLVVVQHLLRWDKFHFVFIWISISTDTNYCKDISSSLHWIIKLIYCMHTLLFLDSLFCTIGLFVFCSNTTSFQILKLFNRS